MALLIILALDIMIHLWSRLKDSRLAGCITKPLLMPLVYSSMFMLSDQLSIDVSRPYMIAAIAVLYTLGDILLMPKDNMISFFIGAGSFMAGHLVFVAYFVMMSFSPAFLILGAAIGAVPFAFYMRKVIRKKTEDLWAFALYGSVILVFFTGAFATFSFHKPLGTILAILGVVFFGYSDSRIVYNIVKHRDTSDFEIMWTYIAANILLSLSVLALCA